MMKKLINALMALALIAGVSVSTMQTAEAHGRRGGNVAAGVAAGIIGLGILGAYSHARDREYYRAGGGECHPGPEECGWRDRRCFENRYGEMVCRGGRWTCWRPTYCD